MQLSDEHRAGLADLIEWHLQVSKKPGRPRGFILSSPRQEWERYITYEVRRELTSLRKQNGGKLRRGTVDQTITKVADRVAETFGGETGLKEIDLNNIRNALKRGKKRKPVSR